MTAQVSKCSSERLLIRHTCANSSVIIKGESLLLCINNI